MSTSKRNRRKPEPSPALEQSEEERLPAAHSVDSEDDSGVEVELARERELAKKRRLEARQYLDSLQRKPDTADDGEVDAAQIDKELIAARLQQDILQARQRVFRKVAEEMRDKIVSFSVGKIRYFKAGNHTPTCVALHSESDLVAAGFKSGDVVLWRLSTGQKLCTFSHIGRKSPLPSGTLSPQGSAASYGHTGHVLCIAISPDGKYLVSGGSDKIIIVWDIEKLAGVSTFTAHRAAVTGLAFQQVLSPTTLYSCSADRTIKIWNLSDLTYLDTLFGHQDEIRDIDALHSERCITVGSRDRTVRFWKVAEESQLVFRASGDADGGSVETVSMIDADHFIAGTEAGALSLWGLHRKKAISVHSSAHAGSISCVRALRLTDLVVSGSEDGWLRFWQLDTTDYKSMEVIGQVPLVGCVNGMEWDGEGKLLAVAVGRDARLGRWNVNRAAKNRIAIIEFQ